MEFNKVIKNQTIELNLQGRTKEEILEELTDLLVKDGAINDKDGFLKDVYDREAVSSTGIGGYVAIPHGKSKSVIRTSIAMGRTIHDIEWDGNFSNEEKILTKYSVPLISNSIAWWVNNASDRYIVVFFCGLAENGIYSVATKIPSILNIFQVIFNQAWSLSAVRDFDPDDRDGFFANTYRAYNCGMVILCSIIISSDKLLAKFLYAKDFYVAWKYVPWLTIAILFGAISGYIGGFFTAVKDSKIFAKSTIYGAVTNIVLNLILTPIIGVLGASVATAISYFEVWALRY